MKKEAFKVGDKVFAKVKGYPAWPAKIVAVNGTKYDVEFYGTKETGSIKEENICYFLKNKEKICKTVKRKPFLDAIEEIEEAIKIDGGDGERPISEDSISNPSDISTDSVVKTGKRGIKRKRSLSHKFDSKSPVPVKQSISESPEIKHGSEENDVVEEESLAADNKKPAGKQAKKEQSTKVTEEEQSNEVVSGQEEEGEGNRKLHVISEKCLNKNIAYAKYVKESGTFYKERPVEPREDHENLVLPVKLPQDVLAGIKFHATWPPKFSNEYDRALYDETCSQRCLELKKEISMSGLDSSKYPNLIIEDIGMTLEEVKELVFRKDMEAKKLKTRRLANETELVHLESRIKSCLRMDGAEPKMALKYLELMDELDVDALTLKKHNHVFEMAKRLRRYVGNVKKWDMTEDAIEEFEIWAEKVRLKAEEIYSKFQDLINLEKETSNFWETYMTEVVNKFKNDCKDLSEQEVLTLCADPKSRQAFMDRTEEVELEKENSSGVANAEDDHTEASAVDSKTLPESS